MTDDTLLRAALRRVPSAPPALRGACLDDDTAAQLVDGTLAGAAHDAAVTHLASCAACRQHIGALSALMREADEQPMSALLRAPVSKLLPARAARAPWYYALAASMVLAELAGLLLSNPQLLPGREGSEYREIRSSGSIADVPAMIAPADGTRVRRAELQFAWAPIENAMYYDVELLSGDGDVLWQARADTTDAAVPESLYLEPDKTLYAWVRAYLADGRTVKSRAVSFAILPE